MDEKFRDFIPDGEETGAITDSGYRDFVPDPEPQPQVIEETPVAPLEPSQPEVTPEPEPEAQPVEEVQEAEVVEEPAVAPLEQPQPEKRTFFEKVYDSVTGQETYREVTK